MLSHPLSNPAISHPSFRIRDLLNLVRLIACFLRRLGNSVLLLSESAIYSISRDSVLLFLLINLAGLAFYGAASSAQSRVTRSFTALLLLLNLARLAILRRCFFFDFLVGVSCSEGELENFLKNSFLGTPAKWSRVTCFGHNLLFAPSLLRIRLVIEKACEDITMYDKSWIHIRRTEKSYLDGVEKFIRVAGIHSKCPGMIVCPCSKCINSGYKETDTVRDHLVIYGISENYAQRDYWIAHGEIDPSQQASTSRPNFPNVVIEPHDGIFRPYEVYDDIEVQLGDNNIGEEYENEGQEEDFTAILEEFERPLYEGCTEFTVISAVVVLYKYKADSDTTNKSFGELLNLLKRMLPEDNLLPRTFNKTKTLLKPFKSEYVKIDACPNDCCLFRKDLKDSIYCPKCGTSRYKCKTLPNKKQIVQTKVPSKVLRYFPIKPRLEKMFTSPDMVKEIIWHSRNRSEDMIRHPVDSEQ